MGESIAYNADGLGRSGEDLHGVANAVSRAALPAGGAISQAFNGEESLSSVQAMVEQLRSQIAELSEGVRMVNQQTGANLKLAGQGVQNTADAATDAVSHLNHR
ncbi:hypothetical protein [Streptomyces sp. NPDC002172]